MVEYIFEAISTLEWPANATAITKANRAVFAISAPWISLVFFFTDDIRHTLWDVDLNRDLSLNTVFEGTPQYNETLMIM